MLSPLTLSPLLASGVLANNTAMHRAFYSPQSGLIMRQTIYCSTVPVGPYFCERSCGIGYVSCTEDGVCFNPGQRAVPMAVNSRRPQSRGDVELCWWVSCRVLSCRLVLHDGWML